MNALEAAAWMQQQIIQEGCLYQDDVVDHLIQAKAESLLRENSEGNMVIGRETLDEFRKLNEHTVVWVRPDRYWRPRVAEDEDGRDARG